MAKTIVAVWLLPLFSVYGCVYIKFDFGHCYSTYIRTCAKLLLFSCVLRSAVAIFGAGDVVTTTQGCCCADGVRVALNRKKKSDQVKSKQVASIQYNARESKN